MLLKRCCCCCKFHVQFSVRYKNTAIHFNCGIPNSSWSRAKYFSVPAHCRVKGISTTLSSTYSTFTNLLNNSRGYNDIRERVCKLFRWGILRALLTGYYFMTSAILHNYTVSAIIHHNWTQQNIRSGVFCGRNCLTRDSTTSGFYSMMHIA